MNYSTLGLLKGNSKPLMLISLLMISSFAIPLAVNSPISPCYMKISHTLLNMIETQGDTPINILITTTTDDYSSVIADIQRLGGNIRNQFQYVDVLAASIPANKILTLAENKDILRIYYDEPRSLAGVIPQIPELDVEPESADAYLSGYETIVATPETIAEIQPCNYWNPTAMGAEPVWELGDYGQDTLVVIIDTGLWAGHFLFAGTSIIGGVDLSPDRHRI
ncbi:hypothetical protein CW707_05455 [Candidatus Bathyarchaeota archaeon]|nr:MAG: hypothetical protein CW707_05455 [Candidatus Bathyarchaeota archaeon]